MKPIGFSRTVDNLGRVCIPKEIRQMMGVGEKDKVVFMTDDGHTVIIAPEQPHCIFCGGVDDLTEYKKRNCYICLDCNIDVTGNDSLRRR